MSASIARLINTLPIPVFGSARTAALFTVAKAKTLPRMVGWAGPLAAGALWFVWPAVDDEWKMEMGLMADPEAAMKAAEAAKEDAPKKVELRCVFFYLGAHNCVLFMAIGPNHSKAFLMQRTIRLAMQYFFHLFTLSCV